MGAHVEDGRGRPPVYPLCLPVGDEETPFVSLSSYPSPPDMVVPCLSLSPLPSPSSPAGMFLHSFEYTNQMFKGTPPSSPTPSISSPHSSRSFNARANAPPPFCLHHHESHSATYLNIVDGNNARMSMSSGMNDTNGTDVSNNNNCHSNNNTGHVHEPSSPTFPESVGLHRFLPRNSEEENTWEAADIYSCNEFRMFEFKVRRCMRGRSHDWTECPFAHPGEKARRRDPRRFRYNGTACPDFRKGACRRGDACEFAHGVFECWLHPARYRTQPCKDGTSCKRRVCFFAHTKEQLRLLPAAAAAKSHHLPPQVPSVLSPTSTLSPPLTPDVSPSRSPPNQPSSPQERGLLWPFSAAGMSDGPAGFPVRSPFERFHPSTPHIASQEVGFMDTQLSNPWIPSRPRGRFGTPSRADRMQDMLASLQALRMASPGAWAAERGNGRERVAVEAIWGQEREWEWERERAPTRQQGQEMEWGGEWSVGVLNEEKTLRVSASLPASMRRMGEAAREESRGGVERVESGRDLGAKIYGSLDLDAVDSPDFSWVGNLVESSVHCGKSEPSTNDPPPANGNGSAAMANGLFANGFSRNEVSENDFSENGLSTNEILGNRISGNGNGTGLWENVSLGNCFSTEPCSVSESIGGRVWAGGWNGTAVQESDSGWR